MLDDVEVSVVFNNCLSVDGIHFRLSFVSEGQSRVCFKSCVLLDCQQVCECWVGGIPNVSIVQKERQERAMTFGQIDFAHQPSHTHAWCFTQHCAMSHNVSFFTRENGQGSSVAPTNGRCVYVLTFVSLVLRISFEVMTTMTV